MKIIVNVPRDYVFCNLSEGDTVYMFDSQTEVSMDLRYETINNIAEYVNKPQNVFFTIEEDWSFDELEK